MRGSSSQGCFGSIAIRDSILAAWWAPKEADDAEYDPERHDRIESFFEKHHPLLHISDIFVRPVSKGRAAFEFLVPPIVGGYANLVDVFVLPEHRGCGYSKLLMGAVMAHPQVQGLRRFALGRAMRTPCMRDLASLRRCGPSH